MARPHLRDVVSVPRSRRGALGVAVALVGPFAALAVASLDGLARFRGTPFLIVIIVASALGRLAGGLIALAISMVLLDYNFLPPTGDLALTSAIELPLLVYSMVVVLTSYLSADRDRAAREARRGAERLELLAQTGDLFAAPTDAEATLRDLADLIVPRLADWFSVDLLEDGEIRNALVVHPDPAKVELARALQRRFPSDPDAPTGTPHVIRTSTSELTGSITDDMLRALIPDPELLTTIRGLGLRCAMTVPLTARGRTFGALTLIGAESHERYGTEDLRLAEEIADRVALAIDTTRLFAAESEARAAAIADSRRNSVLKEITAAFGLAITVDEVMAAMLDQGVRIAGAAAGTVGLVTDDGRVELVGMSGYEPDDHPYWHEFALEEQLPMADAIRERRPVVLSTTQERDARFPALAGRGEQLDHVLVCLPLMLGGQAIGGFSASYPPGTRLGDEDLTFLRAIGEQCAQAIDRARSVARERATRARFDALAKASRALARTLDFDATSRTVVQLALDHLGGRATLYTRERESLVVMAEADAGGARAIAEGSEPVEGPPPEVEEAIVSSLEKARPEILMGEGDEPEGLVLPLNIADATLGALVVFEPSRDFRRADELEFAREIARRMARAIENSRLYRERDYVARTLQRSLLPPVLPEVPGIEIETLFLPAFRGYEVGGDFYDVFEKPKGRWAAVIGDVCGKGVEAAALTGLARHTLRALFEVASPSDALGELNRALLRERLDGRFCTVAYVNIEPDPDGGARLTVACGGHPLPHFIARDGSTSLVGRYGTLIGVTEDPRIEDVEIRLSPGEAIVLFTDGILRKDEAFGDEPDGLTTALRSTHFGSAAEIRERIDGYVRDLIAEEQDDDIAVLVVRAR
jgi:serine phosphatase RsbU (regulator of sigma subunit)